MVRTFIASDCAGAGLHIFRTPRHHRTRDKFGKGGRLRYLPSSPIVSGIPKVNLMPPQRANAGPARKKPSRRDERSAEVRSRLIQAGARTVGRYGYEGASIARITARAKVALGTFYRHFESRQEFFDQLLPAMGDHLLAFVQQRVDKKVVGAKREEHRLRAYFAFLDEHPWYHRLLNESEVMAPKAHRVYFGLMASGLVRSFQRSQARGELRAFREDELETLAYIAMASRVYLAQRYAASNGVLREPPPEVLATYNKFIQRALFE